MTPGTRVRFVRQADSKHMCGVVEEDSSLPGALKILDEDGQHYYRLSSEIIAIEPESKLAPPRFEIGDSVVGLGATFVITARERRNGVMFYQGGGYWWHEENIQPAPEVPAPRSEPATAPAKAPFRVGDLVRLKHESRECAYVGEPEIMVVGKIADDGLIEMTHRLEGGAPSPWAAEHLVLVEHNAKCLRCGHGAFEGLFSVTCQRPGGCKTLDERVGEPRIDKGDAESDTSNWEEIGRRFRDVDIVRVLGQTDNRQELAWYTRHKVGACYATKELAVAAWKHARVEELIMAEMGERVYAAIQSGVATIFETEFSMAELKAAEKARELPLGTMAAYASYLS